MSDEPTVDPIDTEDESTPEPAGRATAVVRRGAVPPPRTRRMPSVVAIVINYNGRDVTLQTLESLTDVDYPAFEIVVVDNGSDDGSAEAVAEAYPEATLVRKEVNEGVAPGMNVGIEYALGGACDYLLILNNDIEVEPSMVRELVEVAESNESVGCVGPKALYYWDRDRIWSAGGILRFRESVTIERGMGEIDCGQYDRVQEVDYINGCALLIRRRVLERVGLFDPIYFIGIEDADWCMRMRRKGYRCAYTPHAVLWHMVSHTLGTYTRGRTFHTGRSTAIFVRRYARPLERVRFLLAMVCSAPAAYLRELASGNEEAVRSKWRGFMEGLRTPLRPPPRVGRPGAAGASEESS